MPLVNVQVVENVFTPEQKHQLIAKITDALFSIKGEAIRGVTWIKIDEIREGNWLLPQKEILPLDAGHRREAAN